MKFTFLINRFNYKLIPSLLFIIFFSLFIRLGFWQLDRAIEKKTYNLELLQKKNQPVVDLNFRSRNETEDDLIWRQVSAEGVFNNNKILLLDNQINHQKPGYLIFSPFIIENTKELILINRGWYPLNYDRNKLPEIKEIKGKKTIRGLASRFPSSGLIFGQLKVEQMSPKLYRVQKMDYQLIRSILGSDYANYSIILEAANLDQKLVTEEAEPILLDTDKNYGYAFQWFAMATALFIIFIKLGIKK